MVNIRKEDITIIILTVLAVTLLGSTIGFLILWRITVEDRNAVWRLYFDVAGIDPSDQVVSEV